jgi:hypothetical protein
MEGALVLLVSHVLLPPLDRVKEPERDPVLLELTQVESLLLKTADGEA